MTFTTAEYRRLVMQMPDAASRAAAMGQLAKPAQPARKPGRLDFTFALQVRNTLNEREHHHEQHARTANEKAVTLGELAGRDLPALPATVLLYRIGGNEMDSDGNAAAMKYVRDAVAERYGVDDADDPATFTWHYAQRPGGRTYAVRIVIESKRTGGDEVTTENVSPAERVARAADALESIRNDLSRCSMDAQASVRERAGQREFELQRALEAWRRSKR